MEQREAPIKLFLKYISENIQVSELQRIRDIRHYLMTLLSLDFGKALNLFVQPKRLYKVITRTSGHIQ